MSASNASRQNDQQFLSASQSDPIEMGWMQGFPPPKEKTLRVDDGSFFEFPALRYSVVHMRQFLPTVEVSRQPNRQPNRPVPLPYALDDNIDALTFQPAQSNQPNPSASHAMTWPASLAQNYTDGIVIMHQGTVVYERYFGALSADAKHAAMSVTKSFTDRLRA